MILSRSIGDYSVAEILLIGSILFVVFMVLQAVIRVALNKAQDKENSTLPTKTRKATLIDIQQRTEKDALVTIIWCIFETDDGERVRVSCPCDSSYVVGDTGTLKWQGAKLISFDPMPFSTKQF